ncbi:hypothetical protein [Priestia koreensis]
MNSRSSEPDPVICIEEVHVISTRHQVVIHQHSFTESLASSV